MPVIREHWRVFAFCFVLLSLAWLWQWLLNPDPSFAAERITIATPSRGLFEFPSVVAIRKGYYKDEGLDVDKVQMQPAIAVKALITGDVDYLLAWGSAIRAAVTGVPIKAVVGMASRPLHVLIARPEIKTPKDLKGKIIDRSNRPVSLFKARNLNYRIHERISVCVPRP